MYAERTHYYAKPGRASDVLDVRRRASAIRTELGLRAGTIFIKEGGGEGPDVQWECAFRTLDEHEEDRRARDESEAFSKIREEMHTVIERFERHVFRREGWGDVDLDGVSLQPAAHHFSSKAGELTGYLYLPPGKGPFAGMVLNHGSGVHHGSTDLSKPSVASVLLSWGIACFFPHRWGYGNSPGKYWNEEVTAELGTEDYDAQLVRRLHKEADDVVCALDYVETLPEIDAGHIAVMGSSFGGTVSLLAAAKCDRFRCTVDFAGAAMNWEHTPRLRELMKQAAKALTCPIFLIQAANDYSTKPTEALAETLEWEGKTYRARVYPAFGVTRDEGHWFERAGSVVWGKDVRSFLEQHL